MGCYNYPLKEIEAQITSNSYSSAIEIKPCYSSSVNRNDFLHYFLWVCLHSQSSRRKISLIIIIKFERRIDFRTGQYVYSPLNLKAQILSNSLIREYKKKGARRIQLP